MSFSMVVGRLILPGMALVLSIAIVWQVTHSGHFNTAAPADRPAAPAARRIENRVVAEGRVVAYPGAEVVVGAEVAGTILRVVVQEKSVVRKGDLLVEFKSEDLGASLVEAVAHLAETEADLSYLERESLPKSQPLPRALLAPSDSDDYLRKLMTARARRSAAKAARDRLDALFAKTRIVAPIDGVVIGRHAQPGETVDTAAKLVTIVDLNRLRIEAEVDEFDIARCASGAGVTIIAEGYGNSKWRGVVEDIPDAVVARQTRPEDPGRPTDSHVLPVKIAFRERTPLKLGQRVEVEIAANAALESERTPTTP